MKRPPPPMSDKPITQSITSGSEQRRNIPVVTVESFFRAHGAKLQLKLEGKRVGFHRKIREPTINRPGLALSGFYNYFAEKRVQVPPERDTRISRAWPTK